MSDFTPFLGLSRELSTTGRMQDAVRSALVHLQIADAGRNLATTQRLAAGLRDTQSRLSLAEGPVSTTTRMRAQILTMIDELDAYALSLTGGGRGGGEEPVVPAWVTALQALGANPSDLVFAYNFVANEGWDGVNEELLDDDMWVRPGAGGGAPFGFWDKTYIVEGVGLTPGPNLHCSTPLGLLPASIADGATILLERKFYSGSTLDGQGTLHLYDYDGDTTDGGLRLNALGDPNFEAGNFDGSHPGDDFVAGAMTLRGVQNILGDGSDIVGSANGRPNVTGAGSVAANPVDAVYVNNSDGYTTDAPWVATLCAVFTTQLAARLPTMSAVS